MNAASFTITIFSCLLVDVMCSIQCNTSGYCQDKIRCDVYQDSEQILRKLQFSEENPGSPRCNAITECTDSDCFRFCWRSPDDTFFMSGFRVYLTVGDHPMESVSMLITLHKNRWQKISITDKKEAVFCVTCTYRDVRGYVNGYVWSQPSLNKTQYGNKACSTEYYPSYLDTPDNKMLLDNNFPEHPIPHWTTVNAGKYGTLVNKSLSATRHVVSRLKTGHIAAIAVCTLLFGSATFGVILFFVKRKRELQSNLYNDDADLDIEPRKPHNDLEDFVSAVTIGTGNLPAPVVGGDLTSNNEVEELHVLMPIAHRTMKMQSHSGCMQCEERDNYDDTSV